MLKFFANIFIFFFLSVVIYLVLLIAWGESGFSFFTKNLNYKIGSPGFMHTRVREIDNFKSIDVLFIGSSATYRGFDTRIFKEAGYNCFNLGSSAQTPMQTELLLTRYVDKIKPKLIVYEISPESLENDGIESELDLIANDKIDKRTVQNSITLNNLKIYNSIIYGAYRIFFNRDENFKENKSISDDRYITGGYVEKAVSDYSVKRFKKEVPVFFKPIPYQENALNNIIKITGNRNIKLITVRAPGSAVERIKYPDDKSIDSFFAAKAVYVNFNNILHLNDSLHFYDNVHLNQNGVKVFNEAVIQEIITPYLKK